MSRLLLGASHKSSGKTTITLGICAALAHAGVRVQPFKKGPDYIDPMWLGRAAGRTCYNLDFNTMGHEEIRDVFVRRSEGSDIALIEGNMGLFDSLDVEGSVSNAEMAKLLDAPVVLVLDVKGATRSVVPVILGFQQFDPELNIAGVILNKVAGNCHEDRLHQAIEHYCDIPIIGSIRRDRRLAIDERHLGLVPGNEAGEVDAKLEQIRELIAAQVDLDALRSIADTAPALPVPKTSPAPAPAESVRIAIARDAAFGFYYPDDLEALKNAGAELVPFSTLNDNKLPDDIDGLFIGGGFPETHLEQLEANRPLREAIHTAIDNGLPAYAECGGLMYLCRSIQWKEQRGEMVGIIPGDVVMHRMPVGRGLAEIDETEYAPWPGSGKGKRYPVHEFHYSAIENLPDGLTYAYKMERGQGIKDGHDGIVTRNLLANYVHLRDVAGNHWAQRFVDFVRQRRHDFQTEKAEAFLPPLM